MPNGNPVPAPEARAVFDAIVFLSRCLQNAPVEVLQQANTLVRDYFMGVIDGSGEPPKNSSEQRVLGALWAEIEMAIEERAGSPSPGSGTENPPITDPVSM